MFISNPKVSLEQITSKFNKLNLPISTKTIGIRQDKSKKELDILIDIDTFITDITFFMEEKPYISNDERDDAISEGIRICQKCPFYIGNTRNRIKNSEYYPIIIKSINKLSELYEFFHKVQHLIPSEYINHELAVYIYDILSHLGLVTSSYVLQDILDATYSRRMLNSYIKYIESLDNIKKVVKSNIENIIARNIDLQLLISGTSLEVLVNKYNISVNKKYPIAEMATTYNLNSQMKDLVIGIATSYNINSEEISVDFVDCILKFYNLFNEICKELRDAVYEIHDKINRLEVCTGVRLINSISDCLNHSVSMLDSDLYYAYQLINGIDSEDSREIIETISLKIPTHFYIFELDSLKVYMCADIAVTSKKELTFYPFYFPNIDSSGNICFGSNTSQVQSMMLKGKFSHILELFWGSDFNHDLVDIGFPELYGNSYTQEYQEGLSRRLQEVFNINAEVDTMKDHISDNNDITYLIKDLEWLPITKYDFYIKNGKLLIINKETRTIHKALKC